MFNKEISGWFCEGGKFHQTPPGGADNLEEGKETRKGSLQRVEARTGSL